MGKRKANGAEKQPSKTKMDIDGEEDDDSGSEDSNSILDVDLEFFDPQPDIDFHGLKSLLRQLFDSDNQLLDLSALSDLILSQPLLGSTVKCDGNESDPFAFLTVLNLHEHRALPAIQQMVKYLLSRIATSSSSSSKPSTLPSLLTSAMSDSGPHIGLILTERLINMPPQIVPPMYTMLMEEILWALEEKEPYKFTHYLVLSKSYVEVTSNLEGPGEDTDAAPQKKKKKSASSSVTASKDEVGETFYFHPEDEILERFATEHRVYEYEIQGDEGASNSKTTFQEAGIRPRGSLALIEAGRFGDAVKAVGEYLRGEA